MFSKETSEFSLGGIETEASKEGSVGGVNFFFLFRRYLAIGK